MTAGMLAAARAVVSRPRGWVKILAFAALAGGLALVEFVALFVHQSGVPRTRRDGGSRLAGEIAGAAALTQTFTMGASGFSGVTIHASPYRDAVTGEVELTVREVDRADQVPHAADLARQPPIARHVVPASEVIGAGGFEWEIPPIESSEGRHYALTVRLPDTPPGQGLALWATRGQSLRGGVLTVGGAEQWGDVVFEAHATRATLLARVEHLLRDQPAWLRSRWTLGGLLLVYNWLLAFFSWYMVCAAGADMRGAAPDS
jgi:hypothetical protein